MVKTENCDIQLLPIFVVVVVVVVGKNKGGTKGVDDSILLLSRLQYPRARSTALPSPLVVFYRLIDQLEISSSD
jgi:hypothetical protein